MRSEPRPPLWGVHDVAAYLGVPANTIYRWRQHDYGLPAAVARARAFAGDGDVSVTAGDVGGQALAEGLVDEVHLDLVPVVFGTGKPFFGSFTDGPLLLDDPRVVVQGDRVLHLIHPTRS